MFKKNNKGKARFTDFPDDTNWVKGEIGSCTFQAKLYDTGSEYGINGGRVSKLNVIDHSMDEDHDWIINYERGWDKKPKRKYKHEYNEIMDLLENSPTRFENISEEELYEKSQKMLHEFALNDPFWK